MLAEWLWTTWREAGLVALSALLLYPALIVLTRLNGLRSFARLSAFDFAMTVAVGSALASAIITGRPSVLDAVVAFTLLFALQHLVARLRLAVPGVANLVDNAPLLLVDEGRFIEAHLREGRVTETDVWAALRRAGVWHLTDVRAVVLETTGDISVIRNAVGRSEHFDERLLTGVRRG
ncbi:MAG: DUF421 domain-containing protein [Dehalococcoidia bacterium]